MSTQEERPRVIGGGDVSRLDAWRALNTPQLPDPLPEAIERFKQEYLLYHKITKGRMRETLLALVRVAELAGGDILQATHLHFRAFLQEETDAGKKPQTVTKIRSQVRPFFRWAWEADLISSEQLWGINSVRSPRGGGAHYGGGTPRPYTKEQIRQLWKDWDYWFPYNYNRANNTLDWSLAAWRRWTKKPTPDKWKAVRPLCERLQTRAVISLALMGGLRRREIYDLDLADMHYENAYIVVKGARKNPQATSLPRAVPWTTPAFQEAVQEWLDLRELLDPPHDRPWLYLRGTEFHLEPCPLGRHNELLLRLGDGWSYHRLRHTAATTMLRSGYPLETVQKVLGHSSIKQTLVYAQILPEDVVRVAQGATMRVASTLDFNTNHHPDPDDLEPEEEDDDLDG